MRTPMHRIAFHLCTYLCKWEYYLKVSTARPDPLCLWNTVWLLAPYRSCSILSTSVCLPTASPRLPCSPLPVAPPLQTRPLPTKADPCLSWFLPLFPFPSFPAPRFSSLPKISRGDCARVDFAFSPRLCLWPALPHCREYESRRSVGTTRSKSNDASMDLHFDAAPIRPGSAWIKLDVSMFKRVYDRPCQVTRLLST